MHIEFQEVSMEGEFSFLIKYSNCFAEDNYKMILPFTLPDRFHWNQWNYMHGSEIECWLIFTVQIKSVHRLVATWARRDIVKYIIISLYFAKVISFKDIFYSHYWCQNAIK